MLFKKNSEEKNLNIKLMGNGGMLIFIEKEIREKYNF